MDGLRRRTTKAGPGGRGSTSCAAADASCVDGDRWFAAEATARPEGGAARPARGAGPGLQRRPAPAASWRREGRRPARAHRRPRRPGATGGCSRASTATRSTACASEIEPVTAAAVPALPRRWQHADPEHRLEGPRGVAEVVAQLAGFEVPAAAWEASVLPARVRGYQREWLDQLTLSGEVAWGRLWGAGASPVAAHADLPRPARGPRALGRLSRRPPAAELAGDARGCLLEALIGAARCSSRSWPRATKLPPV